VAQGITTWPAATSSSCRRFSYGDYLRAGAIARFSPIMTEVIRMRRRGRSGALHLQRFPDRVRAGLLTRCIASKPHASSFSGAPVRLTW